MNSTGHQGQSCINRVKKTGRLIMNNMRHICSLSITTVHYLWKQIKKGLDG